MLTPFSSFSPPLHLASQSTKLDLVQLYWHDYSINNYVDAMKGLYNCDQVKNVGVTNMDVKRLGEIVEAGAPPVLNQIQYSLLDRRPENGMTDFCAKNGNIKLLPYGVLAGGLLTDKYLGVPASEVKFDTYSKVSSLCLFPLLSLLSSDRLIRGGRGR